MKKSVPLPSEPIEVKCISPNVCTVDPGFVNLGTGSTKVTWVNNTAGKIDILIPAHGISGTVRHLSIDSGMKGSISTIKVKDGEYVYAVYCHENGQFAVAGSHPEMIVP
jgi:hypothetical protein